MSNMIRMSEEQYAAHIKRVRTGVVDTLQILNEPVNKFGAQKVEIDGITFDSKREGERYVLLREQQRLGQISGLKRQVPIQIDISGVHICTYVCDFVYTRNGTLVYEDSKGFRKGNAYQLFRLKKALVWACHKIVVDEV